jgi:outer membrane protein assembly factor BamB
MGQSRESDTAWPGSATVHMAGPVRFLSVALALSLAACGSAVSSGSPSAAPESSTLAVATSPAPAIPPGPPTTADDWPFFRGNAARTGEGGSGPVGRPVKLWQYEAQGSVNGAVVIVGDFVYASSDDGVLHALDIETGAERWPFHPVTGPVSAPAVADGVVYAFDGVGTLFALDATTGHIRWHAATPLARPSGPAVVDDTIYVGTGDGAIVALNVSDGSERWRYTFPSGAGGVHNPAFADGIVYAASDTGGLAAVDVATHEQAWPQAFDTGTDITGSVVVAGGIAYVGGTGESVEGHLSAIDVHTGTLMWQLDRPFGAPAVADGVAYVSDQERVEAVDTATGRVLWSKTPVERAQLSVADGVLYLPVNIGHRVDALAAASGAELWHFDVDGGNSCCVAVAHGSVFVATESGSVYRISGDGSTITPASSPTAPPSPSASPPSPSTPPTSSPVSVPSPVAFLWSAPGGGEGMTFPGDMALDPKGGLWVADTGNSRFAIFDPEGNFIEYWEHRGTGLGEFILERSNGDGYGAIAFAPDGSFYVLDVGNRRVEHFDTQRHFVKAWGGFGTTPGTFSDPIGLAIDAHAVVYVLDDVRGVIESYDKDGNVLGSIDDHPSSPPGFNTANSLSLDGQGNFYVSDCCTAGNQVQKLDPSGTLLVTFGAAGTGAGDFANQPGSMAIDGTGRLFAADGDGSVKVFAPDGSFLVSFTAPGVGGTNGWITGLILDGAGFGYVAESGSNLIEKFRLLPPFAP